jgi:transposase-like protein DUF772
MMGIQETPARLFYDFCLEEHVPVDHVLRGIDRYLALDDLRQSLKPFYSGMGRPSVDPELMIRILVVGYCMGIRSERRLCEEVHPIWPIAGFFRRAWVVNSVVFGWPGGKRSEGFRLLCVLNARRRRRTGWVEKDRTA